jgi:hypothetical protein
MIKVKITPNGGYVTGDGPLPFNPDEFLEMFMARIIEARRKGLIEIGFTDDEIDELKAKNIAELQAAPVLEFPEEAGAAKQICDLLDV